MSRREREHGRDSFDENNNELFDLFAFEIRMCFENIDHTIDCIERGETLFVGGCEIIPTIFLQLDFRTKTGNKFIPLEQIANLFNQLSSRVLPHSLHEMIVSSVLLLLLKIEWTWMIGLVHSDPEDVKQRTMNFVREESWTNLARRFLFSSVKFSENYLQGEISKFSGKKNFFFVRSFIGHV